MGLFGKIFEKKTCSICDGEIGLLGNRKLEDGNLCKHCNAKLSPFFDDRRHTTVDGIREHLEYRERNREELLNFNATRTLGEYPKLYVDETNRTFVVSGNRNYRDENADVVPMSEIANARVKIDDYKYEIRRTQKKPDGTTEEVSYNPKRYRYNYDFTLIIEMNENFKWFKQINVRLVTSQVEINPYEGAGAMSFMRSAASFDPHSNPKYAEAERLGEEMIRVLMDSRNSGNPAPAQPASNAAPGSVTCPYCDVTFIPNGSGLCPHCGGPL